MADTLHITLESKIQEDHKEIADLNKKLENTPEKKSLALHGQFEEGSDKKEVKNKEEAGTFIKSVLDNASHVA